jgi:hypothetical protein
VIIDIGCGEGTYSDLARGWRADAFWVGVEVWEPYVGQFDLWRKYDVVAVKDARELILPAMPYVLLAGDVLEHMTRTDAVELLTKALVAALPQRGLGLRLLVEHHLGLGSRRGATGRSTAPR